MNWGNLTSLSVAGNALVALCKIPYPPEAFPTDLQLVAAVAGDDVSRHDHVRGVGLVTGHAAVAAVAARRADDRVTKTVAWMTACNEVFDELEGTERFDITRAQRQRGLASVLSRNLAGVVPGAQVVAKTLPSKPMKVATKPLTDPMLISARDRCRLSALSGHTLQYFTGPLPKAVIGRCDATGTHPFVCECIGVAAPLSGSLLAADKHAALLTQSIASPPGSALKVVRAPYGARSESFTVQAINVTLPARPGASVAGYAVTIPASADSESVENRLREIGLLSEQCVVESMGSSGLFRVVVALSGGAGSGGGRGAFELQDGDILLCACPGLLPLRVNTGTVSAAVSSNMTSFVVAKTVFQRRLLQSLAHALLPLTTVPSAATSGSVIAVYCQVLASPPAAQLCYQVRCGDLRCVLRVYACLCVCSDIVMIAGMLNAHRLCWTTTAQRIAPT